VTLVPPPQWTEEQFAQERKVAIDLFRDERMQEPLEVYLEAFDVYRGTVEDLLETTVDLTRLSDDGLEVLTNPALLEALRYLAGPPISADDLKELADASLAPSRLLQDEDMAKRVVDTVLLGLDRHRFPWVAEGREPTEAERQAAAMASAALMASQRVRTVRANESKDRQEEQVKSYLREQLKMTEVAPRTIRTLRDAPDPGEFCAESLFGDRKADIVVGLYDGRIMPVECKVSNSSTNSVKRLNNDASAKADAWIRQFGRDGTVPTAVVSGVYKVNNLIQAQRSGLTILWAHDLAPLGAFIEATKS
jgi:hypothetical protein